MTRDLVAEIDYGCDRHSPTRTCAACGAQVEVWGLLNGSSALFESDGDRLYTHICHPGAVLLSLDGIDVNG